MSAPLQSDPVPVADCQLDLAGLRTQRDRYRAAGKRFERLERTPQRLEVWFGRELDVALIEEAIEVERGCCPFFAMRFEPSERRLSISVDDPAHHPALDAIQHALTGSPD